MTQAGATQPAYNRAQYASLAIGLLGLALCVFAALVLGHKQQFFRSYLLAFLLWSGVALGCMAMVMVYHLTGGGWGAITQRLLESAGRTLPLLLVLFVPLLFGMRELYAWADPAVVAGDQHLQEQQRWLNVPFFMLRAAIYFTVWIVAGYFLSRWSLAQDAAPRPALAARLRKLSAPGLVLYGLTVTFAAFDWVMSLEPDWYSSIYGLTFIAGQGLAGMAFIIIVLMLLAETPPLSQHLKPIHFNDLGNLLLMFTVLWAYMAFAQYLIIWSGNLPEEIAWYLNRNRGGWQVVALLLVIFHFAVPFFLLLNRGVKRRAPVLAAVALGLVAMRWLDMIWLVEPAFDKGQLRFHWMDILAPVGIGGVWVAAFIWQLRGRPLLPPGKEVPHEEYSV